MFCLLLLLLMSLIAATNGTNSTLAPTDQPTIAANESAAPSYHPTNPPTESPTVSPTEPPTDPPTPIPTAPPTEKPTPTPTVPPTDPPTPIPTVPPTDPPTPSPTFPPTPSPTDPPTESPTQPPTYNPTANPTYTPTRWPTSTLDYEATVELSFNCSNSTLLIKVVRSSSVSYLTSCLQDSLGKELGNTSLLEVGDTVNSEMVSCLYNVPIVSTAQGDYLVATSSTWGDCFQLLISKALGVSMNVTYEGTIVESSEPTDLPTSAPTSSSGNGIGAELAGVWWIIVIVVVVCPILVCLALKFFILKNVNPFIENPDLAYMQMEDFEEANASLNERVSMSQKRTTSFDRDRLTYAPVDELAEF